MQLAYNNQNDISNYLCSKRESIEKSQKLAMAQAAKY